jgi:hypothetical protein
LDAIDIQPSYIQSIGTSDSLISLKLISTNYPSNLSSIAIILNHAQFKDGLGRNLFEESEKITFIVMQKAFKSEF